MTSPLMPHCGKVVHTPCIIYVFSMFDRDITPPGGCNLAGVEALLNKYIAMAGPLGDLLLCGAMVELSEMVSHPRYESYKAPTMSRSWV